MMTKTSRTRWIKLITVALVAAVALGLVGTAGITVNAQGNNGNGQTAIGRLTLVMGKALLDAAAQATNHTDLDLLQQMTDGNLTLSEVITANGGDPAAIKTTAAKNVTDLVNQAVTANKLTQAQADQILKNLDKALDRLLTSPWPAGGIVRLVEGLGNALLTAAADATKLSKQDIIKQMSSGKTLAAVITGANADVAAVKTAATKSITDTVNKAVQNNKLTQDQADMILKNLDAALDKMLNSPWPNLPDADPASRLLTVTAVGVLVKETATEANISQRDLLKDARAGKTLTQIAAEHNADPAKIIAAATTILTDGINNRAKNGKISQDEATKLIGTLPTLLNKIMTSPLPGRTGRNERPGKGNGQPGQNTTPPATPPAAATPSL